MPFHLPHHPLDYPILCGFRYRRGAWVRLLGFGLAVRDVREHGLVFSERHGCVACRRSIAQHTTRAVRVARPRPTTHPPRA